MSLFGGNTGSTNTSTLFGASNNNASAQPNNPFGSFGGGNNNNNMNALPKPTNNVFGSFGGGNNTATNGQPQQTNNAFGGFGSTNQQSTFNNALGSQTQNTGLFGQSAQPQSGGLFGQTMNNTQPQGNSLFGQTTNNQAQNFGASTFGGLQQQSMMQQRPNASMLWQPGSSMNPREKSIPEQMQLVLEKWSPESASCQFQHYFYNRVQADTAPYYGPAPGEDEGKWEEALSKKPDEGTIPVLCRGFSALGNRLRVQVQSVTSLQQRLHEINNSLVAMLQNHDLEISVRTVDAKRRHVALSQRCLQLATKVQILRNRGYAMDSAEEELRQKLTELERGAFDPLLSGRQEEIWARMVGIRARARVLQEEMAKSGVAGGQNSNETIDEDVMRKVKKILGDYDSQISHLQREIEDIRKEYDIWETSKSTQPTAA